MRRAEVWWADLAAPVGPRPVVLESSDASYATRNQATAAYLTMRVRYTPVEVPLGPADGLPQECVANLDNVNTIRLTRLRERLAVLSPTKMAAVEAALRFALALRD